MSTQAELHHFKTAFYLALHEMGHYVVARALGFRTGAVRLQMTNEGGYGTSATLPQHIPSPDEIQTYMEKRALVLFAGVIAENISIESSPPAVNEEAAWNLIVKRKREGNTDLAKIDEIQLTLFNLYNYTADSMDDETFQESVNEQYINFFNNTINLVNENAATIVEFAASIARDVKVLPTTVGRDAETLEQSPAIREIGLADFWD